MWALSNVARLYDGSSAEPDAVRTNVDLFVRDGRIDKVTPHDPGLRSGPDVEVIDASSWTVTPGLIDCHGHVTVLGLSGDDIDRMQGPAGLVLVEKVLHASLVDGGVTTMRDVGGATHLMKRLVDEGLMIGPRLCISICMLSSTGGHADFRGPDRCHGEISRLWPPGPGRPGSVVDGPWECRQRVREIAACGADLIKVCASPGVASPSDHLEHREFTEDELRAIVDEAHARGLRVAAHAHSRSGIELAIRCGVHDLQHISFLDERLVDMAFEAGCTVTPTSWVTEELQRAEGLSPFVMEKVKQVAEHHAQAVDYARRGELRILAGTDPVLPGMHGRNYMELVALMTDGLSALQAWYGATGLAAGELGRDDTGTLTAGRRADLLIADRDVVGDPRLFEAGALVEVVKDGLGHRGLARIPQRTYRATVDEALGRSTDGAGGDA